jgi:glycolate dehydrogenase iron-sulfur subunit
MNTLQTAGRPESMKSFSTAPGRAHNFLDEDKALTCVHCGLCLGSCPTYLETGDENDSPRGRIYLMRAVQEGRLVLGDTAVRHIDLCLGCRACEAVCPSGVLYGELLEHTRDHFEKNYQRSFAQTFLRRFAIEKVFPYPGRLKWALMPAKVLRALGIEKLLPKFARDALSLVPEKITAMRAPEISAAMGRARGRLGFISGCVMSAMFGPTNAATIRLLNRVGYEVITPPGQGCCGALFSHTGSLESARACARQNIEVFEKEQLDAIIINAAGCGSTLKEYAQLLSDDPSWAARGRAFSSKVKDLTEWLVNNQSRFDLRTSDSQPRVTYHDACHLAHAQRITKAPRQLVKAVAGKNFVELAEADVCCGSAGTYNLTEPEMAERLQRRKIENILKSGAQIVVTSNPGCMLQIQAGLNKAGAKIQVLHIADFLDRASESTGSEAAQVGTDAPAL